MIFVVLGMHKSGTTLLARALHESGIPMGEDFPPGVDYAKAKYEARWVQEINDEILGVERQELSLRVTTRLLPEAGISEAILKKIESGIAEAQSNYSQWGFKDPRSVLTYRYWRKLLPEHRLVIVYRDPLEVWKRYSGFNRWSSFRLPFKTWCDYNNTILEYFSQAGQGQAILLNFDRLLSGYEEWERFRVFVNSDLKDVRDPAQSVNRLSGYDRQLLRYRMLMSVAGREASKVFQKLEELRSKQVKRTIDRFA